MVDVVNELNGTANGSILFIIKDDGRDLKYENACRMWKMDAVIEHASQKGFKKAIEEDYDMIVVDDYLGDKSGYTLSVEILNRKNVLLYLLGNDKDDISVIGAFRAGITDYIRSDVSAIQLAARCNTTIMRSHAMNGGYRKRNKEEDKIIIEDMVLDIWKCCVEVNGKKVVLNKMEMEVLQVFMENPERVLTKQEIYERAWKAHYITGENSVATHVHKLRKRLEQIGAEDRIETKWGIGYRFCIKAGEGSD